MTRFYTKLESVKVWNRLRQAMKTLGYDSRPGQDEVWGLLGGMCGTIVLHLLNTNTTLVGHKCVTGY